jgi:3'5'-cyclic nucleotide phosphodiesterase
MSVLKLLGRITKATETLDQALAQEDFGDAFNESLLCRFDPLIHLGCVLAALICTIDRQGVTNQQLIQEGTTLAVHYNNRAVAEQNSIDIGWALFTDKKYTQFRHAVCPVDHDMQRLRQLVVTCVIATDTTDPELNKDRSSRWEKTFGEPSQQVQNRRAATLVLEHLIQVSSVSHCMQHWQVYRKWNERLFLEMYHAYNVGRGDRDPAECWYQEELRFFDFYVIPLAKKLQDCKMFGVSSNEFLNYAEQNREEWEQRGEEIVFQMVKSAAHDGRSGGGTHPGLITRRTNNNKI